MLEEYADETLATKAAIVFLMVDKKVIVLHDKGFQFYVIAPSQ